MGMIPAGMHWEEEVRTETRWSTDLGDCRALVQVDRVGAEEAMME